MAMTLRNCTKCNRMFSGMAGQKHCSKCANELEDDFLTVREYVYDNPGSNVAAVADATGVEEALILKYLRQGKLELKGDDVGYGCDKCNKTITTGKYCDACTFDLKKTLSAASASIAASASASRSSSATSFHISSGKK